MKRAYELEMFLKTVAIKEACFKRFESSSPPLIIIIIIGLLSQQ